MKIDDAVKAMASDVRSSFEARREPFYGERRFEYRLNVRHEAVTRAVNMLVGRLSVDHPELAEELAKAIQETQSADVSAPGCACGLDFSKCKAGPDGCRRRAK